MLRASYFWSQELLINTPWWLSASIIWMLCTPIGVIYLVSKYTGKIPVCFALSGQYGEPLLCVIVFIGIYALQQHQPLPDWTTSATFHVIFAIVIAVVAGALLLSGKQGVSKYWDERYHVASSAVLVYLLVGIAAPAIIFNGSWWTERIPVLVLLALIGLLAKSDWTPELGMKAARIDQEAYAIEKYGTNFRLGKDGKLQFENKK